MDSKKFHEMKESLDLFGGYGEPLEGESSLTFTLFCRYCDLGVNRSLSKLAEIEVKGKKRSISTLGEWSTKYEWQERAKAVDRVRAFRFLIEAFDFDEVKAKYVELMESRINVELSILEKLHQAALLYLDSVIAALKAGETSAGGQWIFRAMKWADGLS